MREKERKEGRRRGGEGEREGVAGGRRETSEKVEEEKEDCGCLGSRCGLLGVPPWPSHCLHGLSHLCDWDTNSTFLLGGCADE